MTSTTTSQPSSPSGAAVEGGTRITYADVPEVLQQVEGDSAGAEWYRIDSAAGPVYVKATPDQGSVLALAESCSAIKDVAKPTWSTYCPPS